MSSPRVLAEPESSPGYAKCITYRRVNAPTFGVYDAPSCFCHLRASTSSVIWSCGSRAARWCTRWQPSASGGDARTTGRPRASIATVLHRSEPLRTDHTCTRASPCARTARRLAVARPGSGTPPNRRASRAPPPKTYVPLPPVSVATRCGRTLFKRRESACPTTRRPPRIRSFPPCRGFTRRRARRLGPFPGRGVDRCLSRRRSRWC